MIAEGKPAPEFELQSDAGETVKLSDLRGRAVVLYFYPKDDTPGCTTEACEFRDAYDVFRDRNAEVLGVSPDDVASHAKFKTKHELPFTLLADPNHEVAEKYGVWGEKNFAGKRYMGINRSTFVIDPEGNVARAMMGIKPAGHASDVLEALSPVCGAWMNDPFPTYMPSCWGTPAELAWKKTRSPGCNSSRGTRRPA